MAIHTLNSTLGEFLDRFHILWIKMRDKFSDRKRRLALKKFVEMEEQLTVPDEKREQIDAVSQQLLRLHQDLWDAEDVVRNMAALMPYKVPDSTDGWLDAAVEDTATRVSLIKYLAATLKVRQLNDKRHLLICKIDAIVGDRTEPKGFAEVARPTTVRTESTNGIGSGPGPGSTIIKRPGQFTGAVSPVS